jgi:hypothetical protein
LAGLTLVFLGHTSAAYHAHPTKDSDVRRTYRYRAGLAFGGFFLSLAASVLCLMGKYQGNDCWVSYGGIALGVAFLVVLATAFHPARGIR